MCGITGVLNLTHDRVLPTEAIIQMLAMIRHRGPDGFGIYRDANISMGDARLSIVDLAGGDQPIGNENETLWVVYNGEIFNYVELRPGLEARGHQFTTRCDTEVILHLFEEYGPECLNLINGQFALALWDSRNRSLFLARDRMGIRPLFYTVFDEKLIFGSEIKSILAYPGFHAQIDRDRLRDVFTYWSVQSPNTIFKGIYELPPGHFMWVREGQIQIKQYWALDFEEEKPERSTKAYLEEFEALLIDSTRIRLRADVPVGAYLSGGLDSSITAAIIRKYTNSHLDTFSIAFSDPEFDESPYQKQMAEVLGTDHHTTCCAHADIGMVFPEVIWHTETPILRTAPAPLFLLSKMVHELNFKVVLTGEGADEVLAGYDIFKEMKIRRFWARDPESKIRPLLLKRLYPDIKGLSSRGDYLSAFFKQDLTNTGSPYYSHHLRWLTTSRARWFLSNEHESLSDQWTPQIPRSFEEWSDLGQAQYLEMTTFLAPYLLSSQGDRMSLGHSVEGRFPFLDYRIVEFCGRLPVHLKLYGFVEKWLLKKLGQKLVPEEIWKRYKRPYRAPIQRSFFPLKRLEYVDELLAEATLKKSGYFKPGPVTKLAQKAASGLHLSETEDMALVGILSTQLLDQQFIQDFRTSQIGNTLPLIKIVDRIDQVQSA